MTCRLLFLLLSIVFAPFTILQASTAGPVHWLKNGHLEAAFTWEKGIRLSVLRAPGGPNLLRKTDDPYHGLKTWLMIPSEILALRDLLSEEPASLQVLNPHSIRLSSSGGNALGLKLEWIVILDPEEPRLEIVHRIHNLQDIPRQAGIWALAAFDTGTAIEIPFSRSSHIPGNFPNSIAIFPFTRLPDPRIATTGHSLLLHLREGSESGALKVGVVQHEGKVLVERSGQRIQFTAPFDPAALYPEGGSNVTVFATPANADSPMGEVEHLGPLQLVEAGDFIEFPQTIQLTEVP